MKENEYQDKFVKLVTHKERDLFDPLLSLMVPIGKLSNERVFGVYGNDYKFRMLDALKGNFESVWMVLGDDAFEELALKFIYEHSENSFDLNEYGKTLPEFIMNNSKGDPGERLLLSELASFEIAFWKVFHSKNIEPVKNIDFTQEQLMDLVFENTDLVSLLSCEHDVFELFKFKDKTYEDFLEKSSKTNLAQKTFYLIYKDNFKVLCKKLNQVEYNFFDKLIVKGEQVGSAFESSIQTVEEATAVFSFIGEAIIKYLKILTKSE